MLQHLRVWIQDEVDREALRISKSQLSDMGVTVLEALRQQLVILYAGITHLQLILEALRFLIQGGKNRPVLLHLDGTRVSKAEALDRLGFKFYSVAWTRSKRTSGPWRGRFTCC